MDQASDGRGSKNAPPASALKQAASEDRLLPIVETEIIPRLMMAHQNERLEAPNAPSIRARDISDFSQALMENRLPDANDIVADICGRGLSMDHVYLGLFAPGSAVFRRALGSRPLHFFGSDPLPVAAANPAL